MKACAKCKSTSSRSMTAAEPGRPVVVRRALRAPAVEPSRAPADGGHIHGVLSDRGTALPAGVRAFMEGRFAQDFSTVRIHADASAARAADAVSARAFTVGRDIVFGAQQFAPETPGGRRLLAHELAHVVQQHAAAPDAHPGTDGAGGGQTLARALASGPQRPAGEPLPASRGFTIGEAGSTLEGEADAAAATIEAGGAPRVSGRAEGVQLQRHPKDLVAYTSGQSGTVAVFDAGKLVFRGPAVSGHPGHSEWEVNVGPTPSGMYTIHPGITRSTVSKSVAGAVCGAPAIGSGYQQITSTDQTPCAAGSAHYCNVSCPTTAEPARLCWTPRDCWGSERIRIEGSADVAKPTGGTQHRDGFYLHGGNPADPVSSGCIKALDTSVFGIVRPLKGVGGAVPFCVGTGCPKWVHTELAKAVVGDVIQAVGTLAAGMRSMLPLSLGGSAGDE